MSHQSTHRHSLLYSVPQTPKQHPHQPNITAPIKYENDSDNDVVSLPTVPKVLHSPDEYDSECQCSTCQLATKLLAECTCEKCKGTRQPGNSSENVPIANAVSPTNGQPSSSSIQNNDASTSEHTNANDQHDDHSRCSTPDYLPRFFDDESGDSSSDDCEDDDDENDKESDQESVNEEDKVNRDPDYTFNDSSSDESENDDSVDDGDDSCDNLEVDNENESLNSIVPSQPSTSCRNAIVTNVDKSYLIYNKSTNSDDEGTDLTPDKCPKCPKTFSDIHKLLRHYQGVHQEWKPYYCRWPKCNFASAIDFFVLQHAYMTHFKSQNRQKAKKFVGKRHENPPNDPVLEQIVANKFGIKNEMLSQKKFILNSTFNSNCPKCGRNFRNEVYFTKHLRSHTKSGFRCTWLKCGFFFCKYELARKHVLKEHLKGLLVNSTQLNEHLIKVDPDLSSSNRLKNNDADHTMEIESESEEDNDNRDPDYAFRDFQMMNSDNWEDDDSVDDATEHSQLSTSPSVSSDSSDNEWTDLNRTETGSNNGPITIKCPKCERTFTHKSVLLNHYRAVHQEWKPYYCRWPKCNFTSALDNIVVTHTDRVHFKLQNRQIAKTFVGKREEAPPKDPSLEQIDLIKFRKKGFGQTRSSCPQCGRNFYSEYLKRHIRTHANPGYSCAWPNCGFFFSHQSHAKKHLYSGHLQVEMTNLQLTKRYLVKVNTRIGKTEKLAPKNNQRTTFNSNCPKCGRNFRGNGQFTQHFRTHTNSGFCCAKCGAFYSNSSFAKKHLLMEHFKGKLVNETKINELIIRVDPNKHKSNELLDSIQNNDLSTSEHTNDQNDQHDDHSRSSTPDYLPRFFEDESGDSSSDDSEDDVSVDDGDEMELVQESEHDADNDNNDPDYAFNDSSSDDSENDDSVDVGGDSCDNMEVDKESLNSNVHSKPLTSCQNAIVTNVDKSNLIDNGSTNSDDEGTNHGSTQDKCPKCAKTFSDNDKLLIHYRVVHQEWKPYYCRWLNCKFTSAINHIAVSHADRAHFKAQNRQKAKTFVGKRVEDPPKDPVLEQIVGIKLDREKKSIYSLCTTCGRNFPSGHLNRHIRTHAYPGFRCTWPNCGFFYSIMQKANKHICTDHLRIETASPTQTNQYLVKVNPKTEMTPKVMSHQRRQREKDNHDNSENDEEDSSSDENEDENGDDRDHNMEVDKERENLNSIIYFQPSTSYENDTVTKVSPTNGQPSSSSIQNNDAATSEHTNANDQHDDHSRCSTPDYLPRFFDDESGDSSSDDSEHDDDSVDDGVDQKSEHCDSNNDPEYSFSRPSESKFLDKIISPRFACPKCKRNMPSGNHLKSHILSHTNPGIRCTWSECGFFFSRLNIAKKHVCVDHLQVDKINSKYINKHLINVSPRTGKTTKVSCRPRRQRKEDNSDNSEDEENSDSDNDGDENRYDGDYKELAQESEERNDNSDPDYAFRDSCLDDDAADGDDEGHNIEIDKESLNSIVFSQPSTSYQNSSTINDNLSNSNYNESANLDKEDPTPVKCPKCAMTFTKRHSILCHYRKVHQEWKPFYCRWPKCNFVATEGDIIVEHANNKHFKSQNRQNARKYVGKRDKTPPKDPVLELIIANKFDNGKIGFGQSRSSCPRCGRNFYSENLKRHIRTHANPGYSCAWPNCGFFFSLQPDAKRHLYSDHLRVEKTNLQLTKRYLVKVNPGIGKTEKVAPRHNKKTTNFNSICPKCCRNFRHRGHLKRHLCIHTKKGFRCTWPQCGFFYSSYIYARKHLFKEHFKDKLVTAAQINENLIEVDPNLPNSNGLHDTNQNNGASTSEHTNANDQHDDHSRSLTPDYLPRFFDDESGDSSSDDSGDDSLDDEDDKKLDQKSKHDDNSNDPEYDFLNSPTFACPQCKRNLPSENHLKSHILSHANPGIRCTWSQCGFFYSRLYIAMRHVCVDHLQVDKINSKYINKHLINVNPITGETTKVSCCPRRQGKEDNSDNSENEDSSSDDDESS